MNIRNASPSDPISQVALEGMLLHAPVLEDIEFYIKPGASDLRKQKRDGSTSQIFRALNANNSATPPDISYETVPKKLVSFDASVDVANEDRNEDVHEELAAQTRSEAISAGFIFQEKYFEADPASDEKEFSGLRALVHSDSILLAGENGLEIPLGNTDAKLSAQQRAVERLLQHIATVRGGATHAYMNESLKTRLLTVAKALNYYRNSQDELGNSIDMINNVIIRGAGYKESGAALLPFNEAVGNSADCSSIFLVRHGERVDLSAVTSAGVKGRFAGQFGNLITNNINLDMALSIDNKYAIVQSKGWRLS